MKILREWKTKNISYWKDKEAALPYLCQCGDVVVIRPDIIEVLEVEKRVIVKCPRCGRYYLAVLDIAGSEYIVSLSFAELDEIRSYPTFTGVYFNDMDLVPAFDPKTKTWCWIWYEEFGQNTYIARMLAQDWYTLCDMDPDLEKYGHMLSVSKRNGQLYIDGIELM